jgi:hypothetical protein
VRSPPGIVHWQTYYEKIHSEVSSYMIAAGGVVLDPRPPDEGFEALAAHFGEPRAVILMNRHHYRQAADGLVRRPPDGPSLAHGLPVVGDGRRALEEFAKP